MSAWWICWSWARQPGYERLMSLNLELKDCWVRLLAFWDPLSSVLASGHVLACCCSWIGAMQVMDEFNERWGRGQCERPAYRQLRTGERRGR